jgi:hypothetical protein
LQKQGCVECSGLKRLTTEEFIKKVKLLHGNKYDYSKVNYINNHTKVCIICPEHGEFWQLPQNHLKWGCKKCSGGEKLNTKIFIERSLNKHGRKYDYSKSIYQNINSDICIICQKHGEF